MKYIDAEKLRSVLQNTVNSMKEKDAKGERYDAFLNGKLSICEELLGCITSLQQEQPEPTCKTCGFYENNCPFIRGKLIPYPNKVCKDYIHSAMKEQEHPEVELMKEMEEYFGEKWKDGTSIEVQDDMIKFAHHFWNKGFNARKEE